MAGMSGDKDGTNIGYGQFQVPAYGICLLYQSKIIVLGRGRVYNAANGLNIQDIAEKLF